MSPEMRHKTGQFNWDKCLQELDGQDWGEAPDDASYLVCECHRLRRVPLKDLTVGNLRVMIGQDIGLEHLMPLTLERLSLDPLAEGDFYGGDLLQKVLSVPPEFWAKNPDWADEVSTIAERAIALCACSPEAADRTIPEVIRSAFAAFNRHRTH